MSDVELRPKTISSGDGAFRNAAIRRRVERIEASTARERS
jgi:hypothetical protein